MCVCACDICDVDAELLLCMYTIYRRMLSLSVGHSHISAYAYAYAHISVREFYFIKWTSIILLNDAWITIVNKLDRRGMAVTSQNVRDHARDCHCDLTDFSRSLALSVNNTLPSYMYCMKYSNPPAADVSLVAYMLCISEICVLLLFK